MRNPLNKRIPRELRSDFGKYFVIFAFMVLLISLVSGFLVAMKSCTVTYYEGMDKYNVEHGHLTFDRELDDEFLQAFEDKANIDLFKLYYVNVPSDKGANIRIYKNREEVDLACIMEGVLPSAKDEIALDRLFAENNEYEIGSIVRIGGRDLKMVGTVALPDYSCLYEDNSDMMFNATNFSIAVMTPEGFDQFRAYGVLHNYAWKHREEFDRYSKKESEDLSKNLLEALEDVLTDRGEALLDEAVEAGKIILLDEMLRGIDENLTAMGANISMYDSTDGRKELLSMINTGLEEDGVDLSEELSDGKRDVVLTDADLSAALARLGVGSEKSELPEHEDVKRSREVLDTLEDRIIKIKDYVPAHKNHAINFTIDDIGGDTAMFVVFSYIVIIVIAFVFAVTTSSTIYAEAGAIGTLRASGYTRRELLRHYMALPVMVTLIAGIVGNILGYTLLKEKMAALYFHSYSLLKYETVWSGDAFVMTTVIPIILMFVINIFVISRKLRLSPIKFLRHDLRRRSRKWAFPLSNKISFMQRFRLRVVLQNMPNYFTLLLGIALGGMVVIFSLMFPPLIGDYRDMILDGRLSNYQYFLNEDYEVEDLRLLDTAEGPDGSDDPRFPAIRPEKFLLTMLKSNERNFVEDDVSIYVLEAESQYVHLKLGAGDAFVSAAYAEKYSVEVGDVVRLNDPYVDKDYSFEVSGIYDYYGALAVFIGKTEFEEIFDESTDYAEGIFSNRALDIEEEKVAKQINLRALTMMSDQLEDSIGGFMEVLRNFGVIMFVLLMYLLSKQIIERSANSISMAKILGFKDGEIGSIYILATSFVVVLGLILACPLGHAVLSGIFKLYLYRKMAGFIPLLFDKNSYIIMIAMGLACYAVVSFIQMRKIKRIPKAQVLKNIE